MRSFTLVLMVRSRVILSRTLEQIARKFWPKAHPHPSTYSPHCFLLLKKMEYCSSFQRNASLWVTLLGHPQDTISQDVLGVTPYGVIRPLHQPVHFLLAPTITVVVYPGNSSQNWKMNSELSCKECQLTKIAPPKPYPDRFAASRATVFMAWKSPIGCFSKKKKKNPSALWLTFQKGNAWELPRGPHVLFKTQKTQRALCSTPPRTPRLGTKSRASPWGTNRRSRGGIRGKELLSQHVKNIWGLGIWRNNKAQYSNL